LTGVSSRGPMLVGLSRFENQQFYHEFRAGFDQSALRSLFYEEKDSIWRYATGQSDRWAEHGFMASWDTSLFEFCTARTAVKSLTTCRPR
jgi:hypothetical protein